jgi:hypothetical protein
MSELRFFDAAGNELHVGTRLTGGGKVSSLFEWDIDQRPSVGVEYDGVEDAEVWPTRCQTPVWMDHDPNRVCDDVMVEPVK